MSSLPSDFFFLVEKIDIYLFKLFVRIYLLLYDCNLMLSDGEYNLLTYLRIKTVFTSGANLKSNLCQNKSKLPPNSYTGYMH